ncbi:hypothetical protein KSP39_PZI005217 [Platanthera zijinensis]|uniref:Uncharacterized protein n=1 Tax=Platanthera zijinensis TaxID=2320716 RepID=A0AAP0BR51_9ASPA
MGGKPEGSQLRFGKGDEDGHKMMNEYVREFSIGRGSYGKVENVNSDVSVVHEKYLSLCIFMQVLYRKITDGKKYAIKLPFPHFPRTFYPDEFWFLCSTIFD